MGISKNRIHRGRETFYPWEREGIDYVLNHEKIPDVDPYLAWELQEFTDPSTGRLYEVDLLFLGRHALYLIEIKSHPGIVQGDYRDWYFTENDGRIRTLENPYSLANTKAKVLKGLLEREMKGDVQAPRVEALVFLSNPIVQNRLSPHGNERVVTRSEIVAALTHGTHVDEWIRNKHLINKPIVREVSKALHKLGLRPSQASRLVGEYKLGDLLDEDDTYQEYAGVHRSIQTKAVRIRSYLVPRATSVDRQQQLKRAARREAEVLTSLGDHPGILQCLDYIEQAPLGPSLLFEAFEGGVPIDVFLRRQREEGHELTFDERLTLIQRVAEALDHCHKKSVLHRNLEPRSVLVRRTEKGDIDARLHRFHLAMQEAGSGTSHLTAFQGASARLFCAPEVLDDAAKASVESDVFSLGALTYSILTEQPPAKDLVDYQTRLDKEQGFSLKRIRDDFSDGIVEVIRMATSPRTVDRPESPVDWVSLLLEEATRPPPLPEQPILDPYDARPGDILDGGLRVEKVLGTGSTARVLKVVGEDKRTFALKVPHDERQVPRLEAEARVLSKLRHEHVVQSHGMRRIGGRECLLLDFAAERTLAGVLRDEGTVVLDYGRRFGDDLLRAVQYLEENGVEHRDIKPTNIGFTPDKDKKARHLILFDFSLAESDPTSITAGTAAYRDPHLRRRGRWDAAADRWASAVTLYQMLTGALPTTDGDGAVGPIRIEAERFDPSVRDRLLAFFEKAFAPEIDHRHATAEEMRHAWVALFDSQKAVSRVTPPSATVPPEPSPAPDAVPGTVAFDAIQLETAVEALSLSARARNALDRAGVMRVRELLSLPRNHLSAVRGVGRKVAKEIQDWADSLRLRFSTVTVTPEDAFAPGYHGPRIALRIGGSIGLEADAYYKLRDAGINTTAELAGTPNSRIEHCLGEAAAKDLRDRLVNLSGDESARTLNDWAVEFFATATRKPSKPEKQVHAYLGLDPKALVSGVKHPWVPTLAEVARSFGVSKGTVLNHVKERLQEHWSSCSGLPTLVDTCTSVVEALGGASAYRDVVIALVRDHRSSIVSVEESERQAAALLRVVTELDADDSLVLGWIQDKPWIALDSESLAVARRLGEVADGLASCSPVPATDTVRRELSEAVIGTPLSAVPVDRLADLASKASRTAAVSSRLELYPRGLAPERVLDLCASSVLGVPELKAADLRERVKARYPEANPLPDRPALDGLVEKYGLSYVENDQVYRRKGQEIASTSFTVAAPTRLTPASTSEPVRNTPEALEARAFHEALSSALARGRFRVIQVPSDEAEDSARILADQLELTLTSLDQRLWTEVKAVCARDDVPLETLLATDRGGPTVADWHLLREIMNEAATAVVSGILTQRKRPQLLVHPGAFARYRLDASLHALVERGEHEDGAAIFLLLASLEDGAAPSINNELPVPVPLPGQHLRLPRSWLRNEHTARASSVDLREAVLGSMKATP